MYTELLNRQNQRSAVERLEGANEVSLHTVVNEQIVIVGTAEVCRVEGTNQCRRQLHGHDLNVDTSARHTDLIVIRRCKISNEHKEVPYPYKFEMIDDHPVTLADLHVADFYVWDTRAMLPTAMEDPGTKETVVDSDNPDGSKDTRSKATKVTGKSTSGTDDIVEVLDDADEDEGSPVSVQDFNTDSFQSFRVRVNLPDILPCPDDMRIRKLRSSHINDTTELLRRKGNDPRVWMMTVTVHLSDHPASNNIA